MKQSEYQHFKKAFWSWFDNLATKEKKTFWYYREDAAETFFYNKYWRKK